ncbi:hypothetical protein CC79DRAFT_1129217 [Sarocladium strictum]
MSTNEVGQGLLQTGGSSNVTQNFNNYGAALQKRSLQETLHFPEFGYRERTVEAAQDRTCTWFLESEEYRNWVASSATSSAQSRLLWIKAKAGAGKSTLMRFAIKQARDVLLQSVNAPKLKKSRLTQLWDKAHRPSKVAQLPDIILSHFFNARGNALEKSAEGLYRTLLLQLLKRLPHLADELSQTNSGWQPAKGLPWPVPTLVDLLVAAVQKLDGQLVAIYVDALDECDQNEVRDMVDVFAALIKSAASNRQTLRVCFASRAWPVIHAQNAVHLDLGRRREHQSDIMWYISDRLRIGSSSQAESIKKQVMKRSNGVFLWVKLVVKMLNEEYAMGRLERLDKWVQGSHGDLDMLYREMLLRRSETDDEDQDSRAQKLCFQWVLYAFELDNLRELWWGIQLGLDYDVEDIRKRSEETDQEVLERYVSTASRGLVECVRSQWGVRAQFIHETARRFVISDRGPLQEPSIQDCPSQPMLQGYIELKRCCYRLLEHCQPMLQGHTKSMQAFYGFQEHYQSMLQSSTEMKRGFYEFMESCHPRLIELYEDASTGARMSMYTLLQHAQVYIFSYANAIQKCGSQQGEWITDIHAQNNGNFATWTLYDQLRPSTPLIDILVAAGLDDLMRGCWALLLRDAQEARRQRRLPCFFEEWTTSGYGLQVNGGDVPLRSALSRASFESVKLLLELYLELETAHPIITSTLQYLRATWVSEREDWKWGSTRSALLEIADHSEGLALFFLVAATPTSQSFNDTEAEEFQQEAYKGFAALSAHILERDLANDLLHSSTDLLYELRKWAVKHGHENLVSAWRISNARSRLQHQWHQWHQ